MSIEAMKQTLEKIANTNAMDYEYQRWAKEALAIAELESQEPVALQMDVIVVNLVREGINKHRARELAEHFIRHTHSPQRKPLTDEQIQDAVNNAVRAKTLSWVGYIKKNDEKYTIPVLSPSDYQFARAIEAAHGIKE